jgi:hypothetical protein
VVLADAIARAALPPAEIPLGLVTAVAGGPFFIVLLHGGSGHEPDRRREMVVRRAGRPCCVDLSLSFDATEAVAIIGSQRSR